MLQAFHKLQSKPETIPKLLKVEGNRYSERRCSDNRCSDTRYSDNLYSDNI